MEDYSKYIMLSRLNWIENNKSISKTVKPKWNKIIEKIPQYAVLSIIDISSKVEIEKLDKKLTVKMLNDFEKFYMQ
jgi:hypothetical protein